ncbi:hypothetical protein B0H14DRAFT_2397960 [Mycena olivaceomarginata]|nr:hypothetical protein B0H14DRAFT_2397960 [Mycena olivaceomarginata]
MLPSRPKIFHGRDSELADILGALSRDSPRIAILGAGGMGKTTLAKVVMHQEEIAARYQQNRHFVDCNAVTTKAELAALVAAHLGMKPVKDFSPIISYFSHATPSLLILDNLETIWEPLHTRREIEASLSLLADITHVVLIITMRGAERPAQVQWTRPFLDPLRPLPQAAAYQTFVDIADAIHSTDEVEKVLQLTDNMPLAVTLMAHLVNTEDCSTLISRWETERTSLLSHGYDQGSNLELSILLSLSSPRITAIPQSKQLLSLLAIVPDGLSDTELLQSHLPIQNILGCKSALLRTALAYSADRKRLRLLVPVREYMLKFYPPSHNTVLPLLRHFEALQSLFFDEPSVKTPALISELGRNFVNLQNVLTYETQQEGCDLKTLARVLSTSAHFPGNRGEEGSLWC